MGQIGGGGGGERKKREQQGTGETQGAHQSLGQDDKAAATGAYQTSLLFQLKASRNLLFTTSLAIRDVVSFILLLIARETERI